MLKAAFICLQIFFFVNSNIVKYYCNIKCSVLKYFKIKHISVKKSWVFSIITAGVMSCSFRNHSYADLLSVLETLKHCLIIAIESVKLFFRIL